MRRSGHIPIRTCMGCGAREPQASLFRVGFDEDGKLVLLNAQRHRGRSGYLHPLAECHSRFAARKGSLRSLRRTVDRAARTALAAELKQYESGVARG